MTDDQRKAYVYLERVTESGDQATVTLRLEMHFGGLDSRGFAVSVGADSSRGIDHAIASACDKLRDGLVSLVEELERKAAESRGFGDTSQSPTP